jgi:hypothetical protein
MPSVFYSTNHAELLRMLAANQIVAGNLYFETDTNTLFIGCSNTESQVGLAPTSMLLSGDITLGFNGAVGADGPAGPQGIQGIQGPAGAGSIASIHVATANYVSSVGDTAILANSATAISITITTTGLTTGQITSVTNINVGLVTVVGQTGLIDGNANVALLQNESVNLLWTGSAFVIQ